MSFEKPFSEEKLPLEQFQDEIAALRDKEKEEGEERAKHLSETTIFPEVDVSKLSEEDREIWEKCKADELTLGEFEEYRSGIEDTEKSRHTFAAFVAHELTRRMLQKEKE